MVTRLQQLPLLTSESLPVGGGGGGGGGGAGGAGGEGRVHFKGLINT
jgi:hypothetical protein